VYTYNSSNLEEAWWTAKTTKANGLIPTMAIPGIQNRSSPISLAEAAVPTSHHCRGFQMKSTNTERQTGNAVAAAAETTKPYLRPWKRYNLTE